MKVALPVVVTSLLALIAGGVFIAWTEVNERHFDTVPAEPGWVPPFLPADASAIDLTSEVDNGLMRCRFQFARQEPWTSQLTLASREKVGLPSTFAFTDSWTIPASAKTYCYLWPNEGTRGWVGRHISVAVDEDSKTAWCWWNGPAVPECG